jgi:magnesium transporter
MTLYFSQLLGRTVCDGDGRKVGRLGDLIAHDDGLPGPRISAVVVRHDAAPLSVSIGALADLAASILRLQEPMAQLPTYRSSPRELYLARDLLDKKVVLLALVRTARINDLKIEAIAGRYCLTGIDIGTAGILRRLGLSGARADRLVTAYQETASDNLPWEAVACLSGEQPVHVANLAARLVACHPMEAADLCCHLGWLERDRLLQALDPVTCAHLLETLPPAWRVALLEPLPDSRVAAILAQMTSNTVAGLLRAYPAERVHELLHLMPASRAEAIGRILCYPEHLAGAMMDTEFVAVRPGVTTAQALAAVHRAGQLGGTPYGVYVTDAAHHYHGSLPLCDLLVADPGTPVGIIMKRWTVQVSPLAKRATVTTLARKYNLPALPVVSADGRLEGIITEHEARRADVPDQWGKALPDGIGDVGVLRLDPDSST